MEYVGQVCTVVIVVLSALIALYKAYQEKLNGQQTMELLVNVLKNESMMIDGQFSEETINKLEAFATTIGANDIAVEQAKEALSGRELNFKLGSFKGKPIFISDALKLGGLAKAIQKLAGK